MAGQSELTGPDLVEEGVALEDLASGVPVAGHVEGKPVVVVSGDGTVHAVGARCTHYGGPLAEGICRSGTIHCPWHHAAFDLETGEAMAAPALDPIPVYATTEREGRLFVTGRTEVGAPERIPASTPESVVIVGSGAAGAAAAEALRRHGYRGPVTLVGEEAPVDRPNLSKDYLAGTAPEDWIPLRSSEFYEQAGIELVTGEAVTAIDPAEATVTLDGGRTLRYGALLLATGAEPRRLPVRGGDLPHVHQLRTLDDSRAIIAALDRVEQAVVVGAGFIGLEVAASLRHRDVDVAVVAPEEVPLARVVGEALGRFVADLHREHGVALHLGRGVDEIRPGEVVLDDGTSLPAQLVVVGVGVTPRTALAEAAGLDVDDGIVVDTHLRTSDPRIWAAGDVARFPGPDGLVRVEHWVLAERHGQVAARNMLGDAVAFTEPPFFWSQHYDVPINVTGHLAGWEEEVVIGDPQARDVVVGFRTGDTIRAVASIYRDQESLQAEQALAAGDQDRLRTLVR